METRYACSFGSWSSRLTVLRIFASRWASIQKTGCRSADYLKIIKIAQITDNQIWFPGPWANVLFTAWENIISGKNHFNKKWETKHHFCCFVLYTHTRTYPFRANERLNFGAAEKWESAFVNIVTSEPLRLWRASSHSTYTTFKETSLRNVQVRKENDSQIETYYALVILGVRHWLVPTRINKRIKNEVI